MDTTNDVRDFLMSRRSRITPAQAGLPAHGGTRRVTGLKREEVAMLTGVSTEYYARLERGNLRGVSDSVLDSLARALQLDEAERAHLFDLAKAAAPAPASGTRRARAEVRPSIERILAGMTGTPAYVRNSRTDVIAANSLCFALYTGILSPETLPVNLARFMFLAPRSKDFFVDWETLADDFAAAMRTESGSNPRDRALNSLIGDLAAGSTEFSTRWARHNVRFHRSARKIMRNPLVGEIELTGDALELPGEGLTMIAYSAEPGSHAQDQLNFLASWAASSKSTSVEAQVSPPSAERRTP
ncbi:transcriptional regulator, XRE family [Pseudarthrobacter chlorophenolicus A6]|uniref:Transcriptional regulator, XRE family n=1 Tax=Pseudarthrobacter chlorophenolicus (strain ATCC 700700 / DSM 12829 / CIP 107037 / JCM 12360 / KCTC 9906 / NCIMB 13794 / A6) TaxID=452863 RepID=B8H9K8_PSECP|nr:helix-turn-helix transcriptional regulator [Pseudarthrobacter chlorophenolicus]ACL40077.1 transcriptional regulator, XRE family [Pseudarthrobacter chlorophenolicus A6]SDQ88242.1 Transcriptional regulator, contains XRE-family HTH domain [Pseudarthrobacter chlorophenolicus]